MAEMMMNGSMPKDCTCNDQGTCPTCVAQKSAPMFSNVSINVLQAKHPELKNVEKVYKRIAILQTEDEDKYTDEDFFMILPNERSSAVQRRKKQFKTGFINPTSTLLSSKGDMIFKKTVNRKTDDPIALEFIEHADRSERSLDEIMHTEVSTSLAAFGTVFAVIDKPAENYVSLAEEQDSGIPYMYLIDPLAVMDFDYDGDGCLMWIRYKYNMCTPRVDPFTNQPHVTKGYVTWTQTHYVFHDDKGNKKVEFEHGFGVCPVVIQSIILDPNTTIGRSTFFTSSKYIITANNMVSIASNEIGKSASAILMMNARDLNETNIDRDDDAEDGGMVMTQRTADTADVMPVLDLQNNKPEYLLKNLETVPLATMMADKYFDLACDNEKSTLDVENLNPQSGVAKAIDFEEINAMLANHAECLQSFEKQVALIIAAQLGNTDPAFSVEYPRSFNIQSFDDKMNMLKNLIAMNYPSPTALLTMQQSLVPDITRDHETAEIIMAELEAADDLTETPEQIALEEKEAAEDAAETNDDDQEEIDHPEMMDEDQSKSEMT